jgi:hypothetical protein
MPAGQHIAGLVVLIDAPGPQVFPSFTIPKLCPVCPGDGICPNKLDCPLLCWFCGGQMGLSL